MQRSRPDTYQPPYPAYQSHFSSDRPDYVMAMIGIQRQGKEVTTELEQHILHLLQNDAAGKPEHVERGIQQNDRAGYINDVLLAYWPNQAKMAEFWERHDVVKWLETPVTGPVGWWRECLVAPVSSLDGNYSIDNVQYGAGRYVEQKLEQFHAYFGSMRDRVVDFLSGKADGVAGELQTLTNIESLDKRLRIVSPPDKLCFIRGPFGWDQAKEEEQQAFIDDMLPVFKTGADYLRDNPVDSNCISMRFLDEVDMSLNNGVQVEIIAWFLTLKDLEEWTHHHPTHLAIYKGVFEYMKRFDFQAKLNLGHEVVVVPANNAILEYCNCHPDTGFYLSLPLKKLRFSKITVYN